MTQSFHANGKLLLSGEYLVLDGAKALALPVHPGQRMLVETEATNPDSLHWQSYTHKDEIWFEAHIQLSTSEIIHTNDEPTAERLLQILLAIKKQNVAFMAEAMGCRVQTHLAFPRNWGLGSSSTLLAVLAQWAKVDAYQLLADTFGGSGYDIACANAQGPIFYQLQPQPVATKAVFAPSFHAHLFFAYLGQKQNSREGIRAFRQRQTPSAKELDRISTISDLLTTATSLSVFNALLEEHEELLSRVLNQPRIQSRFPDFKGIVKSLGAWGGDFILFSGEQAGQYLRQKEWPVYFPFQELVLNERIG